MMTKQLKEYIETLSKAHAAGHKCDKELKVAIDVYTEEIGLREAEERFREVVSKEATRIATSKFREFSIRYFDVEKIGTGRLVAISDLYNDFKEFMDKQMGEKHSGS